MSSPRLFDAYLTGPPEPSPGDPSGVDAPSDALTVTTPAGAPAAGHALPPAPPRVSDGDAVVAAQTGRRVAGPFLAFWTNFGPTLCGEPLTDEVLVDGRRVQVFERLVLEEIAPERVVPMGIGAQWLQAALERRGGAVGATAEAVVIADRTAELAAQAVDAADDVPPGGLARYPRRTLADIRFIVIHHTGGAPDVGPAAIDRTHRAAFGWPGIGYHFVVDADGGVHQTQDLTVVSHHARQFNLASVGVALCGNFDAAPPPAGQLDRAAALVAHLVDRLGLPLDAVRGHGELVATPCPGATFAEGWRDALLDAVAHYAGRAGARADARAIVPAGVAEP